MAKLSAAELGLPEHVPCPFCEGLDTELHSAFGSQLSVATYWCRRCATAFESFKAGDAAAGPPGQTSEAGNRENFPGAEPGAGAPGAAGTPPPGSGNK